VQGRKPQELTVIDYVMMSGNDGRVTREVSFVLVEIIISAKQSAEIPGARSSGRRSFVLWLLIFVGPQQ